jgi:drug/metabolite transporter (DMT)-like permease
MAPVSATHSVARSTTTTLPVMGFAAVLGSAALFGTLGPLSRFAYEAGVEPAAWVTWRGLIGLLTLGAFIGWRWRYRGMAVLRLRQLPRRARLMLLIAATMGFTLNVGMFFAFERVTIALALLCFYTYPAMVAAVNVVTGHERLDTSRGAALILAITGMTMVVAAQLDPAAGIRLDVIGIALALGAAVSQTVYVVVSRDGYREVPTEQAIAVVMIVTTLGAATLAIVVGSAASLVPPLGEPGLVPLLLFTGIFAAALPSLGFLYGIRAIGGLRAGILMLFEPVVGVALAASLLSETLAPIQVVGAAAILAAAVILQRTGRPREDAASHAAVAVGGGP